MRGHNSRLSKTPELILIRSILLVAMASLMVACNTPAADLPTARLTAGDNELIVLVADSLNERTRGLSGLEQLPNGVDGMLFVFDRPTITSFTMEDTLIPLDVWYFDEDGHLIGSDAMVPCSSADCISYQPDAAITWALETPAGDLTLTAADRLSTIENG